jgi:3',5'-cyclic AMP phosphodiesterase CpdA
MKTSVRCLLLAAALPFALCAHPDAPEPAAWQPVPYADQLAHAPTPLPDRVVLTWAGDPATTQAVTWRTDPGVARAVAEIAVATEHGPALRPVALPARTEDFASDLGEAHYHSVNFTGLEPDTLYAYRVGDGANWSEWFHFRTASRSARPFSFIYFGDAQNDLKTHWSRVFREAFRDAPRAAFTLHAGDLINHANRDAEWGEWFGAPAWVNATIPVVPTPGNHEHFRDEASGGARTLTRHWRPQFTLPADQGAPAGLEETCYWFDYQGARIIALNSNRLQAEQVPWLRDVLTRNPQRWTIITFHHPIFSPAKDRENPVLRELWKPLFDGFKVDLVLTGHDHTYARSGDVSGRVGTVNLPAGYNQAYDPAIGTVYVVSVSGPKMYAATQGGFALRMAEDIQLYQLIHVEADTLRYEARTATGRLYDAFVLQKREGRPNELREQLPPENRRPADGKN